MTSAGPGYILRPTNLLCKGVTILKKQLVALACLAVLLPHAAAAADGANLSSPFSLLLLAAGGLLVAVFWLWLRRQRLLKDKKTLIARLQLAEQIVDQAPLPILRLKTDFTVIEANRCASADDRLRLIGANLLDLQPELASHPIVAAWQSAKGEKSPVLPVLLPDPEEQESADNGALTQITIEGQEQILWFGTTPGNKKQLQAASSAATQAEESANRMKSEFIANINHEVRTPMNAIIGYTEMLANSELGPKEKRFVAIIHRSSMALVSIFNDIMELSKIDSGRLQIMVSSIRLPPIISEVEGLFKDLAEEKGIRLHCRIAKHLPQSFILDGVRLKQILQNLVSNAVKFTNEGSVELLVEGDPSAENEDRFDLRFTVKDTGIGIPVRDQQKIFELFRQREDASTRQYGGVGLGLTLCSRLTKMMGGRIELASNEGEGARFTVFLYGIQLAQSAPDELAFNRDAKNPEQERKLLVVDDVDLIKDVFVDFFQDSPYKVLTATNGDDALSLAVSEQPVVIFMDLNLAGNDGRSVTEQLRQTAETASIPVVVMTGEMLEEADYKPLFDDFLQKPFRLETLKDIVVRYARTSSGHGPQSATHDSSDGDERLLIIRVASVWNTDLELLRRQASRSGSLADAASLGMAMKERGLTENQPMLAELGNELMHYANEPNILGVDRLLSRLSKVMDRKEP
ncbi:MAG TPA: hypothetical protein DCG53_01820 [Syntrophus sp. (in: bacteria)]|nr:hypothetical protein [Syntrophus sp. (in: bacteria)]